MQRIIVVIIFIVVVEPEVITKVAVVERRADANA